MEAVTPLIEGGQYMCFSKQWFDLHMMHALLKK